MIAKGQKFKNRSDGKVRKVTKVTYDKATNIHQVFLVCLDCRTLTNKLATSWDIDSFLTAINEGYWIEVK